MLDVVLKGSLIVTVVLPKGGLRDGDGGEGLVSALGAEGDGSLTSLRRLVLSGGKEQCALALLHLHERASLWRLPSVDYPRDLIRYVDLKGDIGDHRDTEVLGRLTRYREGTLSRDNGGLHGGLHHRESRPCRLSREGYDRTSLTLGGISLDGDLDTALGNCSGEPVACLGRHLGSDGGAGGGEGDLIRKLTTGHQQLRLGEGDRRRCSGAVGIPAALLACGHQEQE